MTPLSPAWVKVIRIAAYSLIALLVIVVIAQRTSNGSLESIPNTLANFGFSIEDFFNKTIADLKTTASNTSNNDRQTECNKTANEIILNQLNVGNPNGSQVTADNFSGVMKFTLYKAFYDSKSGSCFFAYYVTWIKAPGELYQQTLSISDTAKAKPVWTKIVGPSESQESMFKDLDVAINYIQVTGNTTPQ